MVLMPFFDANIYSSGGGSTPTKSDIETIVSNLGGSFWLMSSSYMTINTDGTGGAPSNSDSIGRILDQVGSAHLIAPSDADRATYSTSGYDHASFSNASINRYDSDFTYAGEEAYAIVLFEPSTVVKNFQRLVSITEGSNRDFDNDARASFILRNGTDATEWGSFRVSYITGEDFTQSTTAIIELGWDGAGMYVSNNGGTDVTFSIIRSDFDIDALSIGVEKNAPGAALSNQAFDGKIAAVIFTTSLPSASQREDMREYLADIGGITL